MRYLFQIYSRQMVYSMTYYYQTDLDYQKLQDLHLIDTVLILPLHLLSSRNFPLHSLFPIVGSFLELTILILGNGFRQWLLVTEVGCLTSALVDVCREIACVSIVLSVQRVLSQHPMKNSLHPSLHHVSFLVYQCNACGQLRETSDWDETLCLFVSFSS